MRDWESFLSKEICERIDRMNSVQTPVSMGMRMISITREGEVRFSMDVDDKHNAVGAGHGGAIFSLADQAFAVASNLGDDVQVALSANISYVKPAKGVLEAVALKVSETRKISVYDVKVFDEQGDLVAVFQGTGYKLGKRPPSGNGK